MVRWLDPAAFAVAGGFRSQSGRWRQGPCIGALAAVALFISWKLSQSRDDDTIETPEEQDKTDVASANVSEVNEEEEELEGAIVPEFRVPNQESERWTSPSKEEILKPGELPDCPIDHLDENQARKLSNPKLFAVPNELAPRNQTEIVPADVQLEASKLDEQVNDDFKDVTEDDLMTAGLDSSLKWETRLIDTSISSMGGEALDAFISSPEAANSEPESEKQGAGAVDMEENLHSTQVAEDVKELREVPKSIVPVGDSKVDKGVVSVTKSDSDGVNLTAEDFPILSVHTAKSNRIFQTDSLAPIECEETTLPLSDSGKIFEEQVRSERESHLTDTDGQSQISRSSSPKIQRHPISSLSWSPQSGSEQQQVVAIVSPVDQKQSLSSGITSSLSFPEQESTNIDLRDVDTSLSVTPTSSDNTANSCGTAVPDGSEHASRDSGYCGTPPVNSDDNEQSSSSVKSIIVDVKDPEDEVSNLARREYVERLHSYDEYLDDPALSPTLRAQVLRAKASIARYFDDSDDEQ